MPATDRFQAPQSFLDTSFAFDDRTRRLRATAVIDVASIQPSGELLASLVVRLNAATEREVASMRAGGRFEADYDRCQLLLTREFDLGTLGFDELVMSLRRLSKVAARWSAMRPARVASALLQLGPGGFAS